MGEMCFYYYLEEAVDIMEKHETSFQHAWVLVLADSWMYVSRMYVTSDKSFNLSATVSSFIKRG